MLHKRLLAAATATFLALGMAVGGASPAMAAKPADTGKKTEASQEAGSPSIVCDAIGYTKPAELDSIRDDSTGSYDAPFGTISWDGTEVTIVVDDGYTAEICIKGGSDAPLESGVLEEGTHVLDKGKLSHIGFTYDEVEEPGVATASVTPTDPTCELGASLDDSSISAENASPTIVDDGSEDGTYEVTFVADDGFEFADGSTEKSITGTLAGPDSSLCEEPGLATAVIDFTDPNCFSGELLDELGFDGDNSSYVIVDDGSEDGTYEVVFTADEGYEFSTGETTETFTGTLAPALEGDDCTLGLAQAWLEFTAATCLDPEVVETPGEAQVENAVLLDSTVNDDGSFEFIFGLAGGGDAFDTNQTDFVYGDYEKDVTVSYNDDFTELTISGTLAVANDELCEEQGVVIPEVTKIDTCLEQSYTITAVEGVTYVRTVDGVDLTVDFAGAETRTYSAPSEATVVVTAVADEGYALAEDYEPWEYTFSDGECLVTSPVTSASLTSTQPDCLGNPGSYTLTNEPGVIWTVDGVVVEGNKTYTAAVGSTPSIEASLEPVSDEFPTGFGWNDENQQTEWELAFVAADDCLPTLAITGASNALGGLGMVAVLIMMAGTGLVVARRREAARIQG